jgi:hypothetical protein
MHCQRFAQGYRHFSDWREEIAFSWTPRLKRVKQRDLNPLLKPLKMAGNLVFAAASLYCIKI